MIFDTASTYTIIRRLEALEDNFTYSFTSNDSINGRSYLMHVIGYTIAINRLQHRECVVSFPVDNKLIHLIYNNLNKNRTTKLDQNSNGILEIFDLNSNEFINWSNNIWTEPSESLDKYLKEKGIIDWYPKANCEGLLGINYLSKIKFEYLSDGKISYWEDDSLVKRQLSFGVQK